MLKPAEIIWREGFAAGEVIGGSYCPYRPGSDEADFWEDGWSQGLLKREGCFYREGPLRSQRLGPGQQEHDGTS
jgi:hypothetical protein